MITLRELAVVLSSFLAQFVVFGIFNSFTVFTHALHNDASLGSPSLSQLGVANSVSFLFGNLFAAVVGYVVDRVGPTAAIAVMLVTTPATLLLSSLAQSIAVFTLLYGLISAVAIAGVCVPATAVLATWFSRGLPLTLAIAAAGGGFGSALMPFLCTVTLNHFGGDWRVAFRYLALIAVPLLFVLVFLRLKHKVEATYGFKERLRGVAKAAKTVPFVVLYFAGFTYSYTFSSIFFLMFPYATSFGAADGQFPHRTAISASSASSLYLFAGIAQGILSFFLGAWAIKINVKAVYAVAMVVGAVSCLASPFASEYWSLALCMTLGGFAAAGGFALFPTLLAQRFSGPFVGSIIGAAYTSFGFGFLAGSSLSAVLADHARSFLAAYMVMTAVMLVSGLLVVVGSGPAMPSEDNAADPLLVGSKGEPDGVCDESPPTQSNV